MVDPAATVPSEHGNAVVHAPLLETNVRAAGSVSLTVTSAASEVPEFVTVIVYVAFCPATNGELAVLVIERSALVPSADDDVAVLFAAFGSDVVELTVAVFEMVPVAAGLTA